MLRDAMLLAITLLFTAAAASRAADPYPVRSPLAGSLSAPIELRSGPAEPSGAVFLHDLGGVLVVDDEPTESPQRGLHFLVRAGDKRLRALPVVLSGEAAAYTWDDIEGVARDSTYLYWIASHQFNSSWRQRICRAPLNSIQRTKANQLSIEKLACNHDRTWRYAILAALGLGKYSSTLNIEAFTWNEARNVFYIGTREPLVDGKAAIVSMDVAKLGRPDNPHFALAHLVDLGGRGIRAMTFLGDRLLLVAGPVQQEHARFDLFRFDHGTEKVELLTPNGFPSALYDQSGRAVTEEGTLKVEGLAALDDGLLILLDSGEWGDEGALDMPAHYYLLDIAKEEAIRD